MTDFDSEVLDALYESSSTTTKDEDVNPYESLLQEYNSEQRSRRKKDTRLREQSLANAPLAPEDRGDDFYRQEEETESIMQNILPAIIDESYERARDMAAGGAGIVSGIGGGLKTIGSLGKEYLNRDLGIGKLGDVLTEIGNASQEIYATENPDIYNKIGNAVGSMALFAGMGGGVSGAARAITTSTRAANLLGLSAMTGLEAFAEGGNVANQMLQLTGGDEDAAQKAFGKSFAMNLAVLAPTNYLSGYFGGDEVLNTARQVFGKMAKGSFGEGFQEGLQEVIQAYAMGEDLFTADLGKRALESTLIGGLVGGPTAVATDAATAISRESQQVREREQIQKAQELQPGIQGIKAKYQGKREQLQAKREKDTRPAENAEVFYQDQLEILEQQEAQDVLKERENVVRDIEKTERELQSVQKNRQGYLENFGDRASQSAIQDYDTKIQELESRLMEKRQELGFSQEEQESIQGTFEYIQQKESSGEIDPGAAAIAKRLVSIAPDFDKDSTIRVSNEVMEVTEDILNQEGLAGQDPEEYAVTGKTRTRIENDTLKTAIDLYKGHDADTMVEEWYHRSFARMSPDARRAFESYHKQTQDNRSVDEHFAQEGRDFFFSERLHEDAGPIRKLFTKARDSLRNLIGRIRKIRGAKIPEKIQELYREAAQGKSAEQQVFEESEAAQVSKKPVDVNSKEFKRWFGDSKVVDENGKPLVVYHGTNREFDVFQDGSNSSKTGNANAQLGFFFSNSHEEASRYAKNWGRTSGNVIPVFLSINNPYNMPYREFDDLAMAAWRMIVNEPGYDPNRVARTEAEQKVAAKKHKQYEIIARKQAAKRKKELEAQGYDGILVKMGDNITEYIAFSPTQVKSAISNTGEFSLDDARITHQIRKRETIRELKDTEEGRVVIPEKTWQKLESKIKKNILKDVLPKQRKADADEIKDLKTRLRRLKTDLDSEWSEHVKTMKRLGKKVANAEYKEQVLRERYEKKIQDIKGKYANKEQKQRNRKEVDKIVRSIKRLVKRKIPGTYRDRVNSILENLELVRRSKKTLETRLEVREWVEELRNAGEIVPLWLEEELRKAEKVNLNQIDLPTLRNIHAAIKQTVHLGTQRNKFLSEKRSYTIDQAVNQMVKTIDREHKIGPADDIKGPRSPEPQKTQFKNAFDKMKDVLGEHRKVEFIARELDGFKEGLVQDYLIDPVQQAWNAEARKSFEDGQIISKAIRLLEKDSNFKGVRKQVVNFGKFSLTREQMMAVYANTGNPGNLARLLHPNGWNFSESDLQSIENALTENEKQFVRKMADLINSKWEDVARVTEELTGERPEKVEGDWYWPIVTDKNLVKQLKFSEKTQDMFNDIFERIQVERGFTIKRVGGQEPVSLDFFKVLMNHLNQVNHYVTHAPAVRDVSRMLKASVLSDAMRRAVGEQSWKQFQPWLRSVANPKGIGKDALEGVAGKLRRNSTMAILGLKISVSLLQAGSYTQTMHEVGIMNSIKGLLDFYMNPLKWQDKYRKIIGLSTQMRFRQNTFDRDVRNWLETDNMKALAKGKPSAGNMLFALIRTVDMATTLPTWWAAYNQMLNKTRGNVKRSVKYADGVVRRTQPAGSVKDLAQVSKGPEWKKLFTMFYTHYSNYHNQMTNHIRKTKKRGATIPNLVEFTTGVGLLMVVPGLIGTFIRSAGTEDEPSEYFKGLIGYAAGGIIGIRDLVRLATIDWGRDITTTGLKGPADIAVSIRYLQQAIGEPSKQKREDKLKRAGKTFVKGTGTTFGFIPLQFWYVIDAALSGSGDFREFIFGKYSIKTKKKKWFYG